VDTDEWPRAVWVWKGTRVFEGVTVAEAVIVGVAEIRGVAVGVDVSVFVGMVNVGKGPSSAFAVPTIAVFKASAWLCEPPPRLEAVMSRKVTAYAMKTRPIHKSACNKICRGIRFSFFTMNAFFQDGFLKAAELGRVLSSSFYCKGDPKGILTRFSKDPIQIRFVAYLSLMTEILRKGYR
jgi:hypothetical protein